MSLLRLLTAGRSSVGAKPMGRYKFSDPGSMPKFGSGPNPFKTKADEKKEDGGGESEEGRGQRQCPASLEIAAQPEVEAEAEVEGRQSDSSDRSNGPEAPIKEEPVEEQKVVSQKSPGLISRISSLTGSLRLKLWKPRKRAPEPRPVQGELSLDNIKVVRNDLSETDLEVVPLRSGAIAKVKAKRAMGSSDALENGLETKPAPEQTGSQAQEQDLIEASRT